MANNEIISISEYCCLSAVTSGGRCSRIEVDTRKFKKRTFIKHINVSFIGRIYTIYVI